jgi:hypothetical protein
MAGADLWVERTGWEQRATISIWSSPPLTSTFGQQHRENSASEPQPARTRVREARSRLRGKEQAGLRPVLVLSQEVFNDRSGTVIAVALTSQPQRAGFPLSLEPESRK